jgi:pSer/pThr/pTyr-binding forkhead associated (FHA) protein
MNNRFDNDDTSPLGDDESDGQEEESVSDTVILPGGKAHLRRIAGAGVGAGEGRLGKRRQITLVVRGLTQTISLASRNSVVLGRSDHKKAAQPDVDLTRFGAAERGVSREHARLEVRDDNLYLVDLNSTNGTFFKGKQLAKGSDCLLRQADEFLLGRLSIQVLFED